MFCNSETIPTFATDSRTGNALFHTENREDTDIQRTNNDMKNNKRKVAINIYDLEKFYLDEINRQLFTCLSLAEAWDKFGHKNGWTTAEVFAERLREEAQGKKFRYSIKGCIIPTQDKYLSLFQSARSKAWGNYIATYLYDF